MFDGGSSRKLFDDVFVPLHMLLLSSCCFLYQYNVMDKQSPIYLGSNPLPPISSGILSKLMNSSEPVSPYAKWDNTTHYSFEITVLFWK